MADVRTIGGCPNCGGAKLTCRYNHFQSGNLEIHSWEHKCPDCGQRQTTAFRSDDPTPGSSANPAQCPYCQRVGTA